MLVNPEYEEGVDKFCDELFNVLVEYFEQNFLKKRRMAKPILKKVLENKDCLESFLMGYFTAILNETDEYKYLRAYLIRGFKGFYNYAYELEGLAEWFDEEVMDYVRSKRSVKASNNR